MSEFQLTAADLPAEKKLLRKLPISKRSQVEWIETLEQRHAKASRLPGGFVKKILWDEAGGYPQNAWGNIQYSCRPFYQGYGCDGTTDRNVHLIARKVCDMLGLDYLALYREAYPDSDETPWFADDINDKALLAETLVPTEVTEDVIVLMLSDLYQINNRSIVAVLEDALEGTGRFDQRFHLLEDAAKQRVLDALTAEQTAVPA